MTQWDIIWAVVLGLAIFNLLEALVTVVANEVTRRIRKRKFEKIMEELEEAFAELDKKPVRKKATVKKKAAPKRK